MDVHPPKNGMYRYWSIAIYVGTWKSYVPPGDLAALSIRACFCTGTWTIWSSYCICGTSTWSQLAFGWKSGGFRAGMVQPHHSLWIFWSQLAKKFSRWCHHWWMGLKISKVLGKGHHYKLATHPINIAVADVFESLFSYETHRFWGLTWVWFIFFFLGLIPQKV
jgi:hypothetical protein